VVLGQDENAMDRRISLAAVVVTLVDLLLAEVLLVTFDVSIGVV
jgi:hypothetical protein